MDKIPFDQQLRAAEQQLSRRDPIIRGFIRKYGPCRIKPHPRHIETLIGSIISQQLSTKAAATIYGRFRALYPSTRFPAPAEILATPDETLRATGMSGGKVSFVKDIVARAGDGTLKLTRLSQKSDDEIIRMLVQVKGIGVWTAHMFLIFSLGRLDVLPVGDLGVRRGIERAYRLPGLPLSAEIERLADERSWRPYCSVVAWYLWRSLENKTNED